MKNFLLMLTVTSLFLLFFNLPASAAPITNWNFDIQYGFTAYTAVNEQGTSVQDSDSSWGYGIDGSMENASFNAPTKLEWGEKAQYERQIGTKTEGFWVHTWRGFRYIQKETPIKEKYWDYTDGEKSSISINAKALDKTIQLGEKGHGITFSHKNGRIFNRYRTSSTYLDTATLSSKLTITADGFPETSLYQNFDLKFYETPNNSSNPSDILMIAGITTSEKTFDIDGYIYSLSFGVESDDVKELNQTEKSILGLDVAKKYFGFVTPETGTSAFDTWFSVNLVSAHAPEPSTLVLFGIGLVCFAGIIRKKAKL